MESIVELKGKVRKSFTPEQYKNRPWFTEEVTRRLSIYLTWLFIRFGITANQVSLSVFILGIISGVAFIWGHFLIGVLLLQIWYLLDAVDGEVARYHGVNDLTGDYTDKLMHYVIEAWIFYTIGVGLARHYDILWIHYLGLWVAFLFTFLKLIYDLKYKCIMFYILNTRGAVVATSLSLVMTGIGQVVILSRKIEIVPPLVFAGKIIIACAVALLPGFWFELSNIYFLIGAGLLYGALFIIVVGLLKPLGEDEKAMVRTVNPYLAMAVKYF